MRTMGEYIKRYDLLQDISETVVFTVRKGTPLPNAEMRGANKVIDRIKSAPTADVVEVVRCKDCKYCGKYTKWNGEEYYGCAFIPSEIHDVEPMHYCGHGAKMDGKGEGNG